MKLCRICGETKPLDQFHNDKSKKDGKKTLCKPCNIMKSKSFQKTDSGRAHRSIANKKYSSGNRKKRNAHKLVERAIAAGKLQRGPCEVCGEVKAVAHHDDYDHPLVIRWLCEPHHKEWHCANGEALNPD